MDLFVLLCLFGLVLVIILFIRYYKQRWPVQNYPPGPTGLPFIGTFLSLPKDITIRNIAKELTPRYGNVFSVMLDDESLVVATGYDAINEVFQSNKGYNFAGRHFLYTGWLQNPKKLGLFFADYSETWQEQRRFALTTLRGFGFGKTSFESKIMQEVTTLLNHIQDLAKVPQDLSTLLMYSVGSVMCDTLLGCHYDHNDTEFQHLLQANDDVFQVYGEPKTLLMDYFPLSRPFLKKQKQRAIGLFNEWYGCLMDKVKEHETTFDAASEPRDFVDSYLAKRVENPSTFTLEELKYGLSDLFAASTDTASNTLKFALLFMVTNADVQEKVHQELMRVVGSSRLPNLNDRSKMPYTEATILEVQRLAIIAHTIGRRASEDTMLAGYSIPKGTNIMLDMRALQYDPDLWPEPERFDPTRHLNDQGEIVKSPYLMPFGAGRRMCMGETLAKMELFLFFSSLMHRFKFELPKDGRGPPSLEIAIAFTASPYPFQVIISDHEPTTS